MSDFAEDTNVSTNDCISRQAAIDAISVYMNGYKEHIGKPDDSEVFAHARGLILSIEMSINALPSAEPETEKYEYHYDHTDCIWYRPEARNRCPTTCAQYRDGWNDAMNYIFRDGKGYRPYRRDKQYGE